MKKHIPNFITSLNLLCGAIGIVLVFKEGAIFGSYMIWIAAVLDFLDGFTARALKAYSPMGKELDSLADVVSFGVLPGIIMYQLLNELSSNEYLPFLGLMIPVFSALRLAKFNVDTTQTDEFSGLPTPAAAITVSSIIFLLNDYEILNQLPVLLAFTILISGIMVLPVRLISLKFKDFKWENNQPRIIFASGSLILLIVWGIKGVPLVIIFYIIISILSKRER